MTGRRLTLYGAIALLVYLAALLATAPAPWVSHAVERSSRQVLVLRDPAGSAWTGSGHLYARQPAGDLLDLGVLRWDASPSEIFAGKIAGEFALGDNAKPMRVELSLSGVTVRGLNMEVPGRMLGSFAPGLEALGPEGRIVIRSDNLRIDGNSLLGSADVEWRDIRLARANGLGLGSHVARLRGAGSKVDIELGTLEGPLRLSGSGTWARDTGLNVSGTAESSAEGAATVAPFLKSVCSEYRESRCLFRIQH